ncbi:MAG: hypothetical protein ACK4UQ_05190 [Brevundimonas sp.]
MRLPILLTAALLMVAACDQQPASTTPDAAPPAAGAAQDPVMPADAPPQEEAETPTTEAASCITERGEAAAVELASRCTRVSPASHPPCNPNNPCQLVQDEIDRSCAMYKPGEAKPPECTA